MEIFNYLWFAFYGLIAGVLAKTVLPKQDEGGLILTVALGICGSIVGGSIFSFLGWSVEKGFSLSGLIPAITGSITILLVYQIVKKKIT